MSLTPVIVETRRVPLYSIACYTISV